MNALFRYAIAALALLTLHACADKVESLSIVPYPESVEIGCGSFDAFGAELVSEGLPEKEDALVQDLDSLVRICCGGKTGPSRIVFHHNEGLAPEEYEIEIQRVNHFSIEANKGLVIKVVDEELLNITGGIVQGMSGSPLIQNGKLIGAVTHVFVNDPTRGYGIFIENMLAEAEKISD